MYVLIIGSKKNLEDFLDLSIMISHQNDETVRVSFSYEEEDTEQEFLHRLQIAKKIIIVDRPSISSRSTYAIDWARTLGIPVEYASKILTNRTKPSLQIITLCGSMKFAHRMKQIAKKLTLEGNVVLTPCIMGFDPRKLTPAQHETLDQIHRKKIDMCDYVLIINVGGYYGKNTKEEIDYAKRIGKEVRYLEPAR